MQVAALVVLVVAGAFAEVTSLGMAIPFFAALSDARLIYEDPRAQPWLQWFGIETPEALLLPLTVCFCTLAVLSAAVRFLLVWVQTRTGEAIGLDLSQEAFRRTLYQPYLAHVGRNSSEIVSALVSKTDTAIYFVLVPLLMLAGSAVVGASIFGFMLWASPGLTIAAFVILGGAYAAIVAFNRPRLADGSRRVSDGQTRITHVVQESLGGIREVLLGGLQAHFVREFRTADRSLRNAIGTIAILSNAPRHVVEAFAVVTVGAIVFHAAQGPGGLDAAIPTLGALALAIQRLLPMAQQAYFSFSAFQGGRASLVDLLDLLEQPAPAARELEPVGPLPFEHGIELTNVSFRYTGEGAPVLDNVSLSIPKGSRVGIVGETGSGKSTFLDLIMGLILPGTGEVRVDGVALSENNVRRWHRRLAHVPQHIFLADASVADNIAFGEIPGNIDMERVRDAAEIAQLTTTIESWPHGYATRVGERGVQLSGGQRQRIGLARALYRNADLLVLDEATSALDDATEDALVAQLEALGQSLTVVTVAHRQRSLRSCDRIMEVRDGKIVPRTPTV